MGIFSGIKDAQVSSGGVYFIPGLYPEVEIEACKMIFTRKKEELFVAECKIIASDVPERGPDMHASFTANVTKHDAALGNIKGFMAAGFNCSPDEITEAVAEEVVSERQPLAGVRLRLEAVNTKTRDGGDFTKHVWSQVGDTTRAPVDEKSSAPEKSAAPPAAAQKPAAPARGGVNLPGRGARK